MSGFFEEVKRRKVYRVAVGYVVVAGGMIQLAAAAFPAGLIFPLFSGTALLVLWWVYGASWLGAGFIALVLFANEKPGTPV